MKECPTCARPVFMDLQTLTCDVCKEVISTGFYAVPDEYDNPELIIWASVYCDKCMREHDAMLSQRNVQVENPNEVKNDQ
jgi:hypothetical protein